VNADARLLAMLPERIARAAESILLELGVEVMCGEQVVEITADSVKTQSGKVLAADLTVWAAGIKASELLRNMDGLEVNRLNQLLVRDTLQTTADTNIFAIGDCASCPDIRPGKTKPLPATAQAAHQQGSHLYHGMLRRLEGRELRPFRYHDFGTLVSLGDYSTVGTLMGFISGKSFRVEGMFARFMYITLYRQHLYALHGFLGVLLDALGRLLKRGTEPRVKLH